MDITNYFIKHPVIALVLNAVLILVGYLSLDSLHLREYPEVQFPKIRVITAYPNASAEVIENSVTNLLEDKLAGIEGIDTITSESKYGESHITIKFKSNTSIDKALSDAREAVALVKLSENVKIPLVERAGASDIGMPFIAVSLESSSMDFGELTHYANLNLKNAFRGIKGVASAEIWGQPYTYKIFLDAKKMYTFGVNAEDVFNALYAANLSLPAGKFQNEIPVTLNSELKTIKDYENLVIKEKSAALSLQNAVLLHQIADIKLQTDNEKFRVRINGKPGLCIAIEKTNDANPIEVSEAVYKQMEELALSIPKELKMDIISDKAEFVKQSVANVKFSILEAVVFVLIIVFLFLRNIKATIIPLITIPISLFGSFLFLKIFGCSINIMTLLAMVLAIGLVVDDAIIVLENIQRHIEKGLSPIEAALVGSKEISFAIVAVTCTLISVYMPLAFIKGTIGTLFTEFAVALAGSVFISGITALTLSPLMCEKILKKHEAQLWPQIDILLEKFTTSYQNALAKFIDYRKACAAIFAVSCCVILLLIKILPIETAPKEDRSLIGIYIPPILGKDINAMEDKILLAEDKIKSITEAKSSILFMGDWGGCVMLPLVPHKDRKRSAQDLVNFIRPIVSQLPSIDMYPWSYDTGLPGVESSASDGDLSLVISTTESYRHLFEAVEKSRQAVESQKVFERIRHDLKLDTSNYRIDMDTNKMGILGISPKSVAKTLEIFFSGNKSLNFSKDGLLYDITIQGKKAPWNLNELYITNKFGNRISIGTIAEMLPTSGPDKLFHYNQMRSVVLSTDLPENITFGQAMQQFLDQANKELPSTYKKTWSGLAKSFSESKNTMIVLFFLATLFIYAVLSIQFENFLDPLIILLTVPLACLGGLILVFVAGGTLNVYTQVGMITLIGLITKHGILIVEFANQLRNKLSLKESIIQASSLRLRPILMTTAAMVFGAIPLILSSGAGYEARRAIGIVLVGGLTFGTIFTLFILPTIFYAIKCLSAKLCSTCEKI